MFAVMIFNSGCNKLRSKLSGKTGGNIDNFMAGIFNSAGFVNVNMAGNSGDNGFIAVAEKCIYGKNVCGGSAGKKSNFSLWVLAKVADHISGGVGMFICAIGKVYFGAAGKEGLNDKRMCALGIIVSETVFFNFGCGIQMKNLQKSVYKCSISQDVFNLKTVLQKY